MDLIQLLSPARIRVPLVSRTKPELLRELAEVLVASVGGDVQDVLRAVEDREARLSTGIGFGVAIPHGRTPTVPDLTVVAGVTAEPVPFEALDGEPVRIVFLLVGPERSAGQHVKALSRIARLARSEELRRRLLAATTAQEFLDALAQAEAR